MMVAGQGVANEHGVGALGIERPVGLVDQLVGGKGLAALEDQGLEEPGALRRDLPDGADGCGGHFVSGRKMKNPTGYRGVGFSSEALPFALAVFVSRPQAEAQIGAWMPF